MLLLQVINKTFPFSRFSAKSSIGNEGFLVLLNTTQLGNKPV